MALKNILDAMAYVMTVRAIALTMIIAVLISAAAMTVHGYTMNGFELSNLQVSRQTIKPGGPSKDGIPALTDPKFVSASRVAAWLKDDDRVLGISYQGRAKAYPLSIMNWHEIVNDRIQNLNTVIIYCPLCYSGTAYKADINGERTLFGVSGLLYNSNVLVFDRQTESLWSQIKGEAVAGPRAGEKMEPLSLINTTWKDWSERQPQTQVLSRQTGYERDYNHNPYTGYGEVEALYFPVEFRAKGYHPKELVIGLQIDGVSKAYPRSELARSTGPIIDQVNGKQVTIIYDQVSDSARVFNSAREELHAVYLYWFSWYAFHPDTKIYRHDDPVVRENQ